MKTLTLKIDEGELAALIYYHHTVAINTQVFDAENSARIHDLTKRLVNLQKQVDEKPNAETEAALNEAEQQMQNTQLQAAATNQAPATKW